ncbi:BQ5605_C001g00246 [Microbotryum silenes-dioicae]|uniref:BQ5605_C001g00246 protein n=1 Tax=Microbotryum silenes-dioicae TaxID=796604 RepID=A0A2X0P5N4_9BASI|nr:BQ5605_C001g00246 [Microbotryum silenes-dioicae]
MIMLGKLGVLDSFSRHRCVDLCLKFSKARSGIPTDACIGDGQKD